MSLLNDSLGLKKHEFLKKLVEARGVVTKFPFDFVQCCEKVSSLGERWLSGLKRLLVRRDTHLRLFR